VVRLFQYGTHGNQPFLVMEFVEGARTFKDAMAEVAARGEDFTPGAIRRIIGQIIDGLEAAHARGIVHRDIKPENVMLQRVEGNDAFVRIVDFGLAKDVSESNETSVAMGTPVYMAPEQVDRHNIGPWTDWYAVGVMVFELLTGRRPFAGRTQREILARKLDPAYDATEAIADLEMPEAVLGFLRRALARDPDGRWRTAQQFRTAFERAMDAVDAAHKPQPGRLKAALAAHAREAPPTEAVVARTTDVAAAVRPVVAVQGKGAVVGGAGRPKWPWIVAGGAGVIAVAAVAVALGSGSETVVVAADATVFVGADAASSDAAATTAKADVVAEPAVAAAPDVASETVQVEVPPAPTAPPGMVLVAAGSWPLGCQPGDAGCWDDERPAFVAMLPAFAIQTTEVDMASWRACVEAGACTPPGPGEGCPDGATRPGQPVRCVDLQQARAFCAWRGWRLPTEAEWETAARGANHPEYPWGDAAPDCDTTVMASGAGKASRGCGAGMPGDIGAAARDRSWVGAFDLGGNVREWTDSAYAAYAGGVIGEDRGQVVRGGSWIMPRDAFATAHTRGVEPPDARRPDLGLRCAATIGLP
jgi:formylglycine-generating enzyme required for sulfatase activity